MEEDTEILKVLFYYKEGCHLCDQMQRSLAAFLNRRPLKTQIAIEPRDIESKEAWFAEFREYIPVLVVNGEEVCHYFFDEEAFVEALG